LEAFAILEEVEASIQELVQVHQKDKWVNANDTESPSEQQVQLQLQLQLQLTTVPSFVLNARLGGGVKPSSSSSASRDLRDH